LSDLEETINATDCELVLVGTPIDLARIIDIRRPAMRFTYDLVEQGDAFRSAVASAATAKRTR
jgi:predicted GTPase